MNMTLRREDLRSGPTKAQSLHPFKIAWYVDASPQHGEEVIHLYYEQDDSILCDCGQRFATPRYSPRGYTPDLIQMSEN